MRAKIIALYLLLSSTAPAFASAGVTSLYSFTEFSATGAYYPEYELTLGSDGNFYGVTQDSGGGNGAVFKMSPSGTVSILHSFSGGSDGAFPNSALIQGGDGNFYGTTQYEGGANPAFCASGANPCGTIFLITANGEYKVLHSFDGQLEGGGPNRLVQVDGTLWGTTSSGGLVQGGTIFKLKPDATLTTVHVFKMSKGGLPKAGLTLGSDGNFYGTTSAGGTTIANMPGNGSVFRFTPGGVLTTLYTFSGPDGSLPFGLIQGSDGYFYGVTEAGGNSPVPNCGTEHCGTVFRISRTGSFTSLYDFSGGFDGANPSGYLVQASDGGFYGTATSAGASLGGVVFRVPLGGKFGQFQLVHSFGFDNNGSSPAGGLVQAEARGAALYGVTMFNGANGGGTVYRLNFNPLLPSLDVTADFSAAVVGTLFDPTPAPDGEGPAGEFTYDMQFCNTGTKALSGLYLQLTQVGNDNNLIDATVGSTNAAQPGGPTAERAFPAFSVNTPTVPPGACVGTPLQFGLSQAAPFSFTYKLYGHP